MEEPLQTEKPLHHRRCRRKSQILLMQNSEPCYEYKGDGTDSKTIVNDCAKCPYYRSFKSAKGKVLYSTLTVTDDQGNEDPFDTASPHLINQADEYMELLYGLISFIKVHHPKYSKYTELVELLGHEHTLKEASVILGKPYRTLYGWTLTLRPIFDEYMGTVSHIYSYEIHLGITPLVDLFHKIIRCP